MTLELHGGVSLESKGVLVISPISYWNFRSVINKCLSDIGILLFALQVGNLLAFFMACWFQNMHSLNDFIPAALEDPILFWTCLALLVHVLISYMFWQKRSWKSYVVCIHGLGCSRQCQVVFFIRCVWDHGYALRFDKGTVFAMTLLLIKIRRKFDFIMAVRNCV